MKISSMLLIPFMVIAALMIKPELIGIGIFVTALIIEAVIILAVLGLGDDDEY